MIRRITLIPVWLIAAVMHRYWGNQYRSLKWWAYNSSEEVIACSGVLWVSSILTATIIYYHA